MENRIKGEGKDFFFLSLACEVMLPILLNAMATMVLL